MNDRNEADRILGDDWMDPGYRRYVEACDKHPERELLDERKADVENRMPQWNHSRSPRGRLGRVLAARDGSDRQAGDLHRSLAEEVETDELSAQAIIAEHDETPR